MFAVIQVGASQFKVSEGDTIDAPRLKGDEGKSVNVDKVLVFAKGSDIRIGQPFLKDVKVSAKIVKHDLGEKVTAFKFRRRKDSSKTHGHRQRLTALSITKIAV